MKYRKANISDIPYLVSLRKQQLLDEGSVPVNDIDTELTEYFTSCLVANTFVSWLAVNDNTIVATSGICFYRLPPTYSNPTGRVAYITNMFTMKEYRRRGIASALFKLVIDEAKKQNYKLIRLHASANGKPLYSRFGFVDTDGFMALRL